MLNTLADWFNDSQSITDDLKRHLEAEINDLQETCEYCLENQLRCNLIRIKEGESVGWYEPPNPIKWYSRDCRNCERVVDKLHLC